MIGKLSLLLLAAVVMAFVFHSIIINMYPFVLASEEARTSLEVSDSQRSELNIAILKSDLIAFGIFGALLCLVVSVFASHSQAVRHRILTLMVGLCFGGAAGSVMALAGHWFHDAMANTITDPLVHIVIRLSFMLLPIAVAVSLTASFATKTKSDVSNALFGAIVGGLVTATLYGVLSGLVTRLEMLAGILPAHNENRMLLIFTSFIAITLLTFGQIWRTKKLIAPAKDSVNAVGQL